MKSPFPSPVDLSGRGQSVLETLGFEGEYDNGLWWHAVLLSTQSLC